MNFLNILFFMIFYLKGFLKFKKKDFAAAQYFFRKALSYSRPTGANILIYQYYGQTLSYLGKHEEAFDYLSKAYNIYCENGWRVSDAEEYRLVKDSLHALKLIAEQCGLKIEGIDYEQYLVNTKKLRR